MTEQSPLELGETKQEPAYIVLQHANYMERELGRLWLNGDDAKEKAAFIVRAVNCHEELVAALESLIDWGTSTVGTCMACNALHEEDRDPDRCQFCMARAALAKAKEGTAHEALLRQRDLDEETL